MNHKLHTYFMAGALIVGAVLLFTGTGGASSFLIVIAACMAMMFFMMRGMRGMGGMDAKDRDESDHSQDHAPTPR